MPKGYPNTKPEGTPSVTTTDDTAPAVKLTKIKLLRNYRPLGDFEIIGHEKPAHYKKNAAGVEVLVEAASFIEGEQPPPATPGTGFADKIWAGAVIRLPTEEAKAIRKTGIGEYEIDD